MLYNLSTLVLSILLSSDFWRLSQAEIYTAISEIEPLLDIHQSIIDNIDDYLMKENQRISLLKKHLHTFKRENSAAMKNISNYLINPINVFTLIKRLTTDLNEINEIIHIGTVSEFRTMPMNHSDVKYPTKEDLSGAARALTRLKDTYQLSFTDISDGILNGIQHSARLTTSDCFELGKALYLDKDYKNSLGWMMEALRKYNENLDKVASYTKVNIQEFISFCCYKLNDFRSALQWASRVLAIDPNHPRVTRNVAIYIKLFKEQREKDRERNNLRDKYGTINDKPKPETWTATELEIKYKTLCRGEMEISSEISNKLTCRYLTETHPFLRLAPIKMEQCYITPDIFLIYDVMGDGEIEFIKDMAKPRFKRAGVHDSKSRKIAPVSYRITKSAWLGDDEDELVARISQRISDFTGLCIDGYAEALQVANYGIGGHYEPHFDFTRNPIILNVAELGNRIATVLFYMSDVAQGGATVFTELNLTVFPIKNAALFWHNLDPSGQGDTATRHAACPVLKGSKWVSTKWIREAGQELKKPCQWAYQNHKSTSSTSSSSFENSSKSFY